MQRKDSSSRSSASGYAIPRPPVTYRCRKATDQQWPTPDGSHRADTPRTSSHRDDAILARRPVRARCASPHASLRQRIGTSHGVLRTLRLRLTCTWPNATKRPRRGPASPRPSIPSLTLAPTPLRLDHPAKLTSPATTDEPAPARLHLRERRRRPFRQNCHPSLP